MRSPQGYWPASVLRTSSVQICSSGDVQPHVIVWAVTSTSTKEDKSDAKLNRVGIDFMILINNR